jgi:hypothetical protein
MAAKSFQTVRHFAVLKNGTLVTKAIRAQRRSIRHFDRAILSAHAPGPPRQHHDRLPQRACLVARDRSRCESVRLTRPWAEPCAAAVSPRISFDLAREDRIRSSCRARRCQRCC